MLFDFLTIDRVYLYKECVDMRKSIDGLSAFVSAEMVLDPLSSDLFLFCNKKRDKLKALAWHRNGFWLFYKRLVKQKFHWPDWFETNNIMLDLEQTNLLLQGFNLNGMKPHAYVKIAHNF